MDVVQVESREQGPVRGVALPHNLMRDERQESRWSAGGQGATLYVRGRANPARVIDISVHGTKLETSAAVCLDDHVVVAFDGCTPVHACVRWRRDGRVGLHFGRELVLA
jgi:hypothetical protein